MLVIAVVAGVAALVLNASSTAPLGAAKPTIDPGSLPGQTWYLVSWTSSGTVERPQTSAPPTLVFASRTAAHTTDPATTAWTFRLEKGTAFGVQGGRDAEAATAPTAAVDSVFSTVFNGNSTWQITGSTLVFRRGQTIVTFSSDPAAAQHT